jgi:uncharacterized protein YcbK (DUF882 family)
MSAKSTGELHCSRRKLLQKAFMFSVIYGMSSAVVAEAKPMKSCCLSFYHTHTGERLEVVYKKNGWYDPAALSVINNYLRDFRTEEVHPIDTRLLDLLHNIWLESGNGVFEVISGYRSPTTNAMLRQTSNGVAKKSLHMKGRAIDVRLSGLELDKLRTIAVAKRSGGVGYYPQSGFIHLDTGRVRTW